MSNAIKYSPEGGHGHGIGQARRRRGRGRRAPTRASASPRRTCPSMFTEVLPGRLRAHARDRRHRAGAVHLQEHHRAARRSHRGGERARRGLDVLVHAARRRPGPRAHARTRRAARDHRRQGPRRRRDPEAAALIETYLSRHGYDVVKAYTAAEALRKAAEDEARVITLDVILDDVDGFELLQKLKDDPRPPTSRSSCSRSCATRAAAAGSAPRATSRSRSTRTGSSRSSTTLVGSIASPVSSWSTTTATSWTCSAHPQAPRVRGRRRLRRPRRRSRRWTARRPDIILLDLRMPEMDGYEVIQDAQDDARARRTSPSSS